ncbi:MAG: hypothetical protein H0W64_07230 [Gammaproteobacteria bacterium]|nr:hypothetical protein [Gammaproteobacteria bacterium]
MLNSKWMFLFVIAPTLTYANIDIQKLPTSPLLAGTKVVAGDMSQNEFFIVAQNEKLPPNMAQSKKPLAQSSPHILPITKNSQASIMTFKLARYRSPQKNSPILAKNTKSFTSLLKQNKNVALAFKTP